jgi:hypothetical protein
MERHKNTMSTGIPQCSFPTDDGRVILDFSGISSSYLECPSSTLWERDTYHLDPEGEGRVFWYGYYVSGVKRDCANDKRAKKKYAALLITPIPKDDYTDISLFVEPIPVSIFPLFGLEAPLQVDIRSFGEVFPGDLCQLPEEDNVVPLRFFLLLPSFV